MKRKSFSRSINKNAKKSVFAYIEHLKQVFSCAVYFPERFNCIQIERLPVLLQIVGIFPVVKKETALRQSLIFIRNMIRRL